MTLRTCPLPVWTLLLGLAAVNAARADGLFRIGDAASEAAAKLSATNAVGPAVDANRQSFRRLGPNGRLTFELPCDRAGQNYLTVRLDGGEANRNYLYLVQPDGATDVLKPVPETRWGDLDHDSGTPPFPGRYYYSTYDVPPALTAGRSTVRLSIESRGPFAYYGGRSQQPQTDPGKAIYLIAVHSDPWFAQPGDDRLGHVPPAPVPPTPPPGVAAGQFLRNADAAAVDKLLSWQVYGESERRLAAYSPGFPSMLHGAFVTNHDLIRAATDGSFAGREKWSQDQWLDSLTTAAINYQNWCPMFAVELLGNAYVYPAGGPHRRSGETLDRLFAALDFLCLAQGKGGEFAVPDAGPSKGEWIGAATDKTGTRLSGFNWDLQANGVPSLAVGWITVANDVRRRADPAEVARLNRYLDESVDSDHVGRPDKTRRVALATLYGRCRDFFATKGGKDYFDPTTRNPTPSQGFNLTTLYSLNRALQLLESSVAESKVDRSLPAGWAAWPTAAATDRLPTMLADRLGEMADGERWFSAQPDGLSYEGGASAGGYDGNYGAGMQGGLDQLARLTDGDPAMHAAVVARLRAVLAGYSHFYRRESVAGRPVMTADYVVAARNVYNEVRPSYALQPYAATVLADPVARRRAAIFDQDGRAF